MTNQPHPPPTPKRRGALITGGIVAAALALFGGANTAVQRADKPAYLASAITAPQDCDWQTQACVAEEVHVEVWGDPTQPETLEYRAKPLQFDQNGHARTPTWEADLGPLPDFVIPTAPNMGWPVTYMAAVAAGQRPLSYCDEAAQQFDAATGNRFNVTGESVRAVQDKLDQWFEVLPSERRCDRYDLYFDADAQQECGAGAWGCAALKSAAWGYYVDVSVNGDMLRAGTMPPSAVYPIQAHEGVGHGANAGHTGDYGGEGRAHAHPSDMGYICVQGGAAYPCDNTTGVARWEDLVEQDGHTFRFGLRRRGQQPDPTPTPQPTPEPTPEPTPPAQTRVLIQGWIENNLEPCAQPSGDWCIATTDLGDLGQHGRFYVLVKVRPDGTLKYGDFILLEP